MPGKYVVKVWLFLRLGISRFKNYNYENVYGFLRRHLGNLFSGGSYYVIRDVFRFLIAYWKFKQFSFNV